MAHTFTNLLAHVVFSTKDRQALIDADLKPRLLAYMGGIVRELCGTMLTANGPADHLHLLTALPASVALSEALRLSRRIRRDGFTNHGKIGAASPGREASGVSVSACRPWRMCGPISPARRSIIGPFPSNRNSSLS